MQVPTNLRGEYTTGFRTIFPDLAAANAATLMPFLLEGVGGIPALNLPDGIHPNPAGYKIIAENVWQIVEPVLQTLQAP
jgi:acyl-CoA thioesterase I